MLLPLCSQQGHASSASIQTMVMSFDLQGIVVVPHLMTGASDSRHYLNLTANGVYRFFPLSMNMTAGDVKRVHGIDERIKV